MSYEQKPLKEVGALWFKKSKSGNDFISIKLEGKNYLGFKNKYKNNDSQPDARIMTEDTELVKAVEKVSAEPPTISRKITPNRPGDEASFFGDDDVPF